MRRDLTLHHVGAVSGQVIQPRVSRLRYGEKALGVMLIFTSAYAKSASIVTSVSVLGGIIAAGVFLILVALLGVFGTKNQDQAALFFLPCWDHCEPCLPIIVQVTSSNLSRVGLTGLLFSFTEIVGVWLAYRFRNTRDPRIDPDTLFL
ncbi:unnamed protein product [Heligmosomoides polygyrus]|uniref:AA_permease domain-containing protein n=1 Tax=Heligmosomoides polygyrus TaxID=6339 RepID=A0A3P8ATA0_HELPZ|nr:unnamed protein product [Heligmosomoides polygyrus]